MIRHDKLVHKNCTWYIVYNNYIILAYRPFDERKNFFPMMHTYKDHPELHYWPVPTDELILKHLGKEDFIYRHRWLDLDTTRCLYENTDKRLYSNLEIIMKNEE